MAAIIALVIVLLVPVFMYNSLVARKNQVDNVFGSIDALLKKRYDLIPNLVATVQAYMQHEKGTLEEVTALRTRALASGLSNDEKIDLDNKMSKVLGGIMVAVENYPQLKASQNFLELQKAMNEVEEQVSAARRAYNAAVTDYNNGVEMFPTNILAGMMGFRRKQVFFIPEEERGAPNVKEMFGK
ncbi:MAG: LemA family protein [Candidatus Omnitrophica bacterium]|nr:LemA family protein [Candidatus Omnitrophota bacterium]MDD5488729.1 LemA family protein [Candidatus Omnitrophota bacterium]